VIRSGLGDLVEAGALDPRLWLVNIPFSAYVANISAQRGALAGTPLDMDDRTRLEYVAPITQRESHGARRSEVLAWQRLVVFCECLQRELPPAEDPHLARLTPDQRRQVLAGTAFYGAELFRRLGNEALAEEYLQRYQAALGLHEDTR
jgi:hypothetical protein